MTTKVRAYHFTMLTPSGGFAHKVFHTPALVDASQDAAKYAYDHNYTIISALAVMAAPPSIYPADNSTAF